MLLAALTETQTWIFGLITAGSVGLGGLYAASKRLSGKIGTSEATSLWDESKAIRDDYRAQIAESNKRTLSLETRVADLERDNNVLARENIHLELKVHEYEVKIREYEQVIEELRARLLAVEARNLELTQRLEERSVDA